MRDVHSIIATKPLPAISSTHARLQNILSARHRRGRALVSAGHHLDSDSGLRPQVARASLRHQRLCRPTSFDVNTFQPPPHASLGLRLRFAYWRLSEKLHPYQPNPANTTYAASPVVPCSIQGLLNECMQTSGTRYLMPLGVAAGTVRFGNAIALDGRQWIDSFESALQTNRPSVFDPQSKRPHQENLVLIRYPKQKTVLVLPASKAQEFRRTNSTGVINSPHP